MRALFSGWLGEGRGHGLHRRSLAGQLSVSTGGDWIGEFAGEACQVNGSQLTVHRTTVQLGFGQA